MKNYLSFRNLELIFKYRVYKSRIIVKDFREKNLCANFIDRVRIVVAHSSSTLYKTICPAIYYS